MSNDIPATDSLTSFTNDPTPFLKKLRQSGEPILLILENEAAVVVQDAESYQRLRKAADQLDTIEAVKESIRDVAEGRSWPIRDVLAELAVKHRLPPVQGD